MAMEFDKMPGGEVSPTLDFTLDLAGQIWTIKVPQAEIHDLHLPLLGQLQESALACEADRFIVFLAGPPGCGKTTVAALWSLLAHRENLELPVQALPMDGFHYPNYLLDRERITIDNDDVPLKKVKGAPESFDLTNLHDKLRRLHGGEVVNWPRYDRILHDPVPDAITVIERGICLVEGNYLLLDEAGWRDLRSLAHLGIFLEIDEGRAHADLLDRYLRGGRTREDAIHHYEFSDGRNFRRVMESQVGVDIRFRIDADRRFKRVW